jgi:hypothetical protein
MALTKVTNGGITDSAITSAKINDGSIINADIKSDAAIAASKLSATLDLSSKTITLPSASVTAHATTPTLDSPSITGTLFVDSGSTVSHTISNWSDDVTYVITPTNCTVGSVNSSGVFVVTHTSGAPSYTIKATTDSLGLADSSVVTKNIVMNMTAPTISAPADVQTLTDVVYTITSTDSNDDKIILDMGSSNFNLGTVSPGSGTKSGNTVVVTGFTTGNPVVTIQFTAEATYSVTAKSVNIAGTYGDSALSSADSITIENIAYVTATGPDSAAGTISGDYKYHIFNATKTGSAGFVVSNDGNALGSNTVEYLVVAGGGGAGGTGSGPGGGGAGGYRNSYNSEASGGGGSSESAISLSAISYNVTVGGGGAGGGVNVIGASGSDSVFSSITSTAGGYGAAGTTVGSAGGSGGGGNNLSNPGVGTSNQGYAGGNGSGTNDESGGGGGASAVGGNATVPSTYYSSRPGNGGAGLNSSITGSSVGRGGGGAGGGNSVWSGSEGTGTHGGASQPTVADTVGNAGTANTGGGGSGGNAATVNVGGGAGGSGVVIIRYKFQN